MDGTVQYNDFAPRGPYTDDPVLARYFQAFKALGVRTLTDDERTTLRAQPELVARWQSWIDVQSPFLMGTRAQGWLADWAPAPWVDSGCLPDRGTLAFPLAWGPDAEVLERLVAHDSLPPECGVATRQVPSGLDLLAALGDARARALLLTSPEGRFPELPERLAAVSAKPLAAPGVVGDWLGIVRAVSVHDNSPEDVDPATWHRRRMETALSTWVDLRHLLVLVSERGGAQAGAGGEGWFEELNLEPAYGAVDPLPEAWDQLARTARGLAGLVDAEAEPELAELVTKLADSAETFATLARKQAAGEPLTAEQYDTIDWYVRAVEWPIMQLSAWSAPPSQRTRTNHPPPDARIVDIHAVSPPDEPRRYFHIAKGKPRAVRVLLADRGVTVPAHGAVSSYYEVDSLEILDDAAWADLHDRAPRPTWLNPDP